MDKKELLDNLSRLGFSLMETKEDFDVNKTLAEVVKSNDTRLWEGFPVLLANAAQEYYFNYEQVLKNLTKRQERRIRLPKHGSFKPPARVSCTKCSILLARSGKCFSAQPKNSSFTA